MVFIFLDAWFTNIKVPKRFLPMVSLRQLPRSVKNHRFSGPQAPDDSIAMEVNE